MPSNDHKVMMKLGLGPWPADALRSPLFTDLRVGPVPGPHRPIPPRARGPRRWVRLWRWLRRQSAP